MDIGNRIAEERTRAGLDIYAVAKALSVDGSVVSSWEEGKVIPTVEELVGLARVFNVTIDDLYGEIKPEIIKESCDDSLDKVDWTKAWGSKYPILMRYQKEVDILKYEEKIKVMLDELRTDYGYSELDAMLVLKDILYSTWKKRK